MTLRPLLTLGLSSLAVLSALVAPALHARTTSATTPTPPTPTPLVLPAPSGPVRATLTADRDRVLAQGDRLVRLRLDLQADPGQGTRLPTDLVVVMDRSGSMSGPKILDARAAAHELVGQLGPEDRFALVSFASDARVDVPLGVGGRDDWTRAIDGLDAAGSTQMGMGLESGLAQLAAAPGRVRRVVLVSDGMPDRRDGLDEIARRAAVGETPLTTIGIGVDWDEALMQSLADLGTGNFHWVQRGPDLGRVLADELDTARETVASGLDLELRGAELVDAAGFPISGGHVALGTLFAGQKRTLWLTVRVPAGATGDFDLGDVELDWTTPQGQRSSLVADAPVVGVTTDAAAFYAALGDGWADSVVNAEWNALKIDVSAAVQRGDRASALAQIEGYWRGNELLNAHAANPLVADNLDDAQALAREVEQQFQANGDDRNAWAKRNRVEGYLGTRAGQVRGK